MRVFEEKQRFTQWWLQLLNLALLGLILFSCHEWFIANKAVGNVGPNDITGQIISIIAILFTVSILYIFKLETKMDERGIQYRFYPIHQNFKSVAWKDIDKCYVRKYRPLAEYGGWGYKFGLEGKALNVKGNQGIQLQLKDGKKLLIGTQRQKAAQQVIKNYFKNERI